MWTELCEPSLYGSGKGSVGLDSLYSSGWFPLYDARVVKDRKEGAFMAPDKDDNLHPITGDTEIHKDTEEEGKGEGETQFLAGEDPHGAIANGTEKAVMVNGIKRRARATDDGRRIDGDSVRPYRSMTVARDVFKS